MRALLYLRKSTDEHQADSIDTQRAGAASFVRERLRGEIVEEIVDEGESRAEFKRRPGFARLLALCTAKARHFDALVVRDESRLGAGARLTVALDDILAAGVDVYYYASGERVQLDSAEAKIMTAIKAAMAENERAKTAERTRENHEQKARRGERVGGRCYGYDNIVAANGKKDYRINERERAILVEIGTRFANGEAPRTIAHALNAAGVKSPFAGKRRGTGSWSPGCIAEMLRRPRYRGLLEWGRIGCEYRGGTRVTFERKGAEVIMVDRPDLRIFDRELADRIDERLEEMARQNGGKIDREGRAPKYLLSGKAVARCGECGGPIQVGNSKQGPRIIRVYQCAWHKDRGPAVCGNNVRRPVAAIDGVLVDWLCNTVLTATFVDATVKEIRRRLQARAGSADSELATLEAALARLDREIKGLTAVAANLDADDSPEELAGQIAEKQRRRRELRARLDAQRAAPGVIDGELSKLEDEARRRLAELRTIMAEMPEKARPFVEALLTGPITFAPKREDNRTRYELSGSIVTGAVFRGLHWGGNLGDPDGSRFNLNLAVPTLRIDLIALADATFDRAYQAPESD